MQLRPYQQAAESAAARSLARHAASLVSMATGTGKTWVAASIMTRAVTSGWRVLFVAHREELLDQAARTVLTLAPRASLGIVKAEREEWDAQVVLASIQSLTPERIARMPRFHLVVTDEAHHAPAPTYQRLYARARALNPQVRHLGFTATPYTTAPKGKTRTIVGTAFDELAFEYGLQQAMDDGWLVPELRCLRVPTGCTLTGRTDGDLSVRGLDNDGRNEIMVGAYRHYFPALPPALAFAVSVAHAQHLALLFRQVGVPAAAVWGNMDAELGEGARARALQDHRDGRVRVLTTVAVLTEGVDLPHTSVLLMGRPTASLVLWMQMLGRGTRPYPGKAMCGILDFTDNVSARLDLRPAGLADVTAGIQEHAGPHELFRVVARRAA